MNDYNNQQAFEEFCNENPNAGCLCLLFSLCVIIALGIVLGVLMCAVS